MSQNYIFWPIFIDKKTYIYKGIKYKAPSTNTITDNYYIVKKGDTLWDLAKKYNTSVSTLKSLNNLSTNVLKIGQKLKLPSSYYTVKKGDSLWKIAKENNTTINNLIKLNNLKNNTIKVGQKLLIK